MVRNVIDKGKNISSLKTTVVKLLLPAATQSMAEAQLSIKKTLAR